MHGAVPFRRFAAVDVGRSLEDSGADAQAAVRIHTHEAIVLLEARLLKETAIEAGILECTLARH